MHGIPNFEAKGGKCLPLLELRWYNWYFYLFALKCFLVFVPLQAAVLSWRSTRPCSQSIRQESSTETLVLDISVDSVNGFSQIIVVVVVIFHHHSNVQGDSNTSICITIEPGLLLKGDILVKTQSPPLAVSMSAVSCTWVFWSFTTAQVLPQEIQEPHQRRGFQSAVPHLCHPRPWRSFWKEWVGWNVQRYSRKNVI